MSLLHDSVEPLTKMVIKIYFDDFLMRDLERMLECSRL